MAAATEIREAQRVVEGLMAAKAIVQKGWVQEEDAVDKSGKSVSTGSKSAIRFCPGGAIDRVLPGHGVVIRNLKEVMRGYFEKAARTSDIERWNDAPRRKKPEVIKAFVGAILLAKAMLQKIRQIEKGTVAKKAK